MTFIRKSRIITLLLSVTWLIMSLSYTCGTECLCCNHSEYKSNCCEKVVTKECCLDLKHLYKDCQCVCISCGRVSSNDLLPEKEYTNTLGKDQVSPFQKTSSISRISLVKHSIVHYYDNAFPLKYPSLFLINASFLL